MKNIFFLIISGSFIFFPIHVFGEDRNLMKLDMTGNCAGCNLEKVYLPCILQTKKRYVGWKYESVDDEPCFDDKGIVTMRSDQCPVVANVLRDALKALFRTKSGDGYHRRAESRVKRTVVSFWQKMMQGILPLSDYVFSRMLRNNYKVPPPHKIVDTKKQKQNLFRLKKKLNNPCLRQSQRLL